MREINFSINKCFVWKFNKFLRQLWDTENTVIKYFVLKILYYFLIRLFLLGINYNTQCPIIKSIKKVMNFVRTSRMETWCLLNNIIWNIEIPTELLIKVGKMVDERIKNIFLKWILLDYNYIISLYWKKCIKFLSSMIINSY